MEAQFRVIRVTISRARPNSGLYIIDQSAWSTRNEAERNDAEMLFFFSLSLPLPRKKKKERERRRGSEIFLGSAHAMTHCTVAEDALKAMLTAYSEARELRDLNLEENVFRSSL